MTNYNERLDEIFDLPNITRMAKEKGSDVSDIDKHIQLKIVFYDGKHETYPITLSYDLVKQAITSLVKELVADAKPMAASKEVIETYLQNGMTQKAAEYHGRNHAIDEFEQNLLKGLEEV